MARRFFGNLRPLVMPPSDRDRPDLVGLERSVERERVRQGLVDLRLPQ